ncbi:MAG: DNA polymerase III subunit gamma/tau, partial [Thermodesulfobacteriota bacterium]
MSYLVIARKWRPNLFKDIVGQEHVTITLENAVNSGRTAHAYLFSGPRGVGKTTAARILAKSVNCAKGPAADPCNECEICAAITGGSAVDVIEIDGASNTSVDNIRELKESIRFVPSLCRYKVYIIDEVHMLSTSAFNALLKTLEEPPPHALFIFATTEVHKIPRTILSRCQRFDFKRIPYKQICDHLMYIATEEGIKVSESVLELLAREAEGSMRDAESQLDQVIAFAGMDIKEQDVYSALGLMDRSLLYDLSEAVLAGDGATCLNLIENIYNFGYDLKKVTLELLEHIRDLSVLKVTGDSSLLELPEAECARLKELAGVTGSERLQLLFDLLSKGYEDISRSVTPRFTLEMTLLRAAHQGDLRSVGELIDTLEEL